jgi:hypothetical protein
MKTTPARFASPAGTKIDAPSVASPLSKAVSSMR